MNPELLVGPAAYWFFATMLTLMAVLVQGASPKDRRAHSVLISMVFLVIGLSLLLSVSRPIASAGIIPPGSWLTRLTNFNSALWIRRLFEPFMFLLLYMFARETVWRVGIARPLFGLATLTFAVSWILECLALKGVVATPMISNIHFFSCAATCVFGVAGYALSIRHKAIHRNTAVTMLATITLWASIGASAYIARPDAPRQILSAVHYYSWFPENWAAGFAGEHLDPPVLPELGKYDSAGGGIVEQHFNWMTEAGINTVIFDLWTKNPAVRKRVDREVQVISAHPLRFAIQYESLVLREIKQEEVSEGPNDIYMSPARREELTKNMLWIAERYMVNERYLRFDDRPVIFIYAARHLVGPVKEAFDAARAAVRERTGFDLYIVGDEVHFHVLDYSTKKGVFLLPQYKPNWSRLTAFDAITCYNPYDESRPEHGGSKGADRFFADSSELYRRYQSYAATAGIDFIPGVLPGYNDRGVRLEENHFVLPRVIGEERIDFFSRGLDELVRPFVFDRRHFMFAVTSWNEWNEGTQIEPAAISAETVGGASSAEQYSLGERNSGYGRKYLEQLGAFLSSLHRASPKAP